MWQIVFHPYCSMPYFPFFDLFCIQSATRLNSLPLCDIKDHLGAEYNYRKSLVSLNIFSEASDRHFSCTRPGNSEMFKPCEKLFVGVFLINVEVHSMQRVPRQRNSSCGFECAHNWQSPEIQLVNLTFCSRLQTELNWQVVFSFSGLWKFMAYV